MLNASVGISCSAIPGDMKVRAQRDGRLRHYLPDLLVVYLLVVCDPHLLGDVETTPCLIVEILGASTRSIDETFKAADHQRLPSLQGYLLVDSERRSVNFYRRVGGEFELEYVEDTVALHCLDVALSVEAVYRGVLE